MAIINPPTWMQDGSHAAEGYRRFLSATYGGRQGVITSGALAVVAQGTPDMTVAVATGQALIAGDEGTYQGLYMVDNQGSINLTISASDATFARWDLIVARIYDSAYGTAVTDVWALEVVEGTAAASPADPTLPDNCYVLARIQLPALATTVTNAYITDVRVTFDTSQYGRAASLGGRISCLSTARPSSPYAGMEIFETDTLLTLTYNGTAWVGPGLGARITDAGNQSITTVVETTVTLGTSAYDRGGFVSGNTFVIPTGCGGIYQISGAVGWQSSTAGTYRYFGPKINGTWSAIDARTPVGGGLRTYQMFSTTLKLSASDIVRMDVRHDIGSNLALQGGSIASQLSIAWVGP